MQGLRIIQTAELTGKLLLGLPDSPELGTIGMQQRFDAHPNLNTEVLNHNAQVQNQNNLETNGHMESRSNPHAVGKGQIGLDRVENTADVDKPISHAQAAVNGQLFTQVEAGRQATAETRAVAQGAVQIAETAQQVARAAERAVLEAQQDAQMAVAVAEEAYQAASGVAAKADRAVAASAEALALAESVALVYNPATGLHTTVLAALQSLYDLVKSAPMTAQDFADHPITTGFLQSRKLSIQALSTRGKQLLIGG